MATAQETLQRADEEFGDIETGELKVYKDIGGVTNDQALLIGGGIAIAAAAAIAGVVLYFALQPAAPPGGGGGGGTQLYTVVDASGNVVDSTTSESTAESTAQSLANANNQTYEVKDPNGNTVATYTPQNTQGGGGTGGPGGGTVETAKAFWNLSGDPTTATFHQGDSRVLNTEVPDGSSPTSIQAFRTNPDGSVTTSSVLPWDVSATGYTYEITATSILAAGAYSVYTQVTFSDGNTVKSNVCKFTIAATAGGGGTGGTPSIPVSVTATDNADPTLRDWAVWVDTPPGAYQGGGQWSATPVLYGQETSGGTLSGNIPLAPGSHTLYFAPSATSQDAVGAYSGSLVVNGASYGFQNVTADNPAQQAVTV